MSQTSKKRLVDLQKRLKIAKTTLEGIASGHCSDPHIAAEKALEEMFRLESKQQLQGICGHASDRT